jgi:hypothetical protein
MGHPAFVAELVIPPLMNLMRPVLASGWLFPPFT